MDTVSAQDHLSPRRFYHGTAHEFAPGDMISPGHRNVMADSADDPGHAYFTPQYDTARKYAKAASHVTNYLHTPGTGTTTPYVYKVAPTGEYHDDATTDEHGNDYAPGVVQYKSRHPNAM